MIQQYAIFCSGSRCSFVCLSSVKWHIFHYFKVLIFQVNGVNNFFFITTKVSNNCKIYQTSHLQPTMCYFVCFIHLTNKKKPTSFTFRKENALLFRHASLKERLKCHLLIGYFKHVKNYRNFLHVVIQFFSEVEIPIKHSRSLCNKNNYLVRSDW